MEVIIIEKHQFINLPFISLLSFKPGSVDTKLQMLIGVSFKSSRGRYLHTNVKKKKVVLFGI